MTWSVAPSLIAMKYELDHLYPDRSRISDGTIGNAEHAARKSDHNPDDRGIVHARDVTHDPEHGCDCNMLVAGLVFSRDPRILYIIWNDTIWRSYHRQATATRPLLEAWHPEPYDGRDEHKHHAHFSILATSAAESDCSPWFDVHPKPLPPLHASTDLMELLMPVFKDDGDAEVWTIRKAYLDLLLREPESEATVLFWVEDLRRHGIDYVWSRIADSDEGQAVRAAHRKLLGI